MILTEYNMESDLGEMTVAVAADLHETDPEAVLALLRKVQPDLICIPGDTFERYLQEERLERIRKMPLYEQLLYRSALWANGLIARLRRDTGEAAARNVRRFLEGVTQIPSKSGRNAPVFLSLGNHEPHLTDNDLSLLRRTGITLLDNSDVTAELCGREIRIGGLSECADEDWLDRFCECPEPRILLCHYPHYYESYLQGRPIGLILSGHVHGGQMRFFGRGVFGPGQGFFPKYHHGIYHGNLVVSAGCANTTPLPRLGNPCEVVVIHMHQQGGAT